MWYLVGGQEGRVGLWDRVFKAVGRYKGFDAERSGDFLAHKEGQWIQCSARRENSSVLESPPLAPVVLESHRLVCAQQGRSWAPGSLFF